MLILNIFFFKERRKYFGKFWNIMEFCKLILGVSAIAMYIMKSIYVYVVLDDLGKSISRFFLYLM